MHLGQLCYQHTRKHAVALVQDPLLGYRSLALNMGKHDNEDEWTSKPSEWQAGPHGKALAVDSWLIWMRPGGKALAVPSFGILV